MQRRTFKIAAGLTAVAAIAGGLFGLAAYIRGYWTYRGFPPPSHPKTVALPGSQQRVPVRPGALERIDLSSQAVGGRHQPFYVFLPPGYKDAPLKRYPVLYMMHGLRSDPATFMNVGGGGAQMETLVAQGLMKPLILVAPSGAGAGLHADTEWADGIHPGNQWETFIARDLVRAVDARFRTIQSPKARGIAGLSEGGYAAINIAVHHPDVFGFVESWSGYMIADHHLPYVFGRDTALMDYNSPLLQVPKVANVIRRDHVTFWFYIGNDDESLRDNIRFDRLLGTLKIPHTFFETTGAHNWALWRRYTPAALEAASAHFSHA